MPIVKGFHLAPLAGWLVGFLATVFLPHTKAFWPAQCGAFLFLLAVSRFVGALDLKHRQEVEWLNRELAEARRKKAALEFKWGGGKG